MDRGAMTVKEMAEYLHIGKNQAYDLVNTGKIPSFKLGKQIRIPVACINEWMLDQVTKPA